MLVFFFQAEDGIRDIGVTGVQTCALPISVMVACEREYPIVVTTNGGYPLDQNLYQAVKGMSAAYQVVSEGGLIISASRCNDGFPDHGNFRKMLLEHSSQIGRASCRERV